MRAFLLLAVFLVVPRFGAAQAPACPAELEMARLNAVALASSPDFARARALDGIPAAAPADVRLLRDPADAAACTRLHAWLNANNAAPAERWNRSFYRVGNLYYVSVVQTSTRPDTIPPGYVWIELPHHALFVLDLEFERVSGIMM